MKLYSTNHISPSVGIEEAIFQGLPPDNGLYLPDEIPVLSKNFWENCDKLSFGEIAFEISKVFFRDDIPDTDLRALLNEALNFEAPSVKLSENLYCLELFHGPSMAFKDFGARFMAAVMSYFLSKRDRMIHVLVATSGDTGGAVAQGFYGKRNIHVHILYPSGKVSDIQEKQLTTLGQNITALEIDGTFDDCQKLVKKAFLDKELRAKLNLASANSINIARLIPQAFYYVFAYSRLKHTGKPVVFSVPSGNLGNLSAGIIAHRMGMPVSKFIAATNANKVVPEYLATGEYMTINPSISTIANAMDVGNPSNFPRLKALFGDRYDEIIKKIIGFHYSDAETKAGILEIKNKFNYVVCPHTAIAYLGIQDYLKEQNKDTVNVFLSTAHYAKFLPDVEGVLNEKLPIPERLGELLNKTKLANNMIPSYEIFKTYLNKLG
ncbi:MAG: threonine synthase [Arcticibacterium sp.]|jgi:threonine synthase